MADAIALALAKQQDRLQDVVTQAVAAAVSTLERKMDEHMSTVKSLVGKIETVQAEIRGVKREVNNCTSELDKLRLKISEIEDRERRNNVRLVGLASNREGGDAIGFLQKMLPKWIPSLGNKAIEIERAHRIYGSNPNTEKTMIFKVLRYQDRQTILQGARKATEKGPILDAGKTLRFFADYSAFTSQKRKVYVGIRKELQTRGIQSFLIYPATLRVNYKGKQLSFSSIDEANAFKAELSHLPTRRELTYPPRFSECQNGMEVQEDAATATK